MGVEVRDILAAFDRLPWTLFTYVARLRAFIGPAGSVQNRLKLSPALFLEPPFTDEAIRVALAYLDDNPRRLVEKRAHPDFFHAVQDLPLPLSFNGQLGIGHVSALGNRHLLACPTRLQVQCSRSEFAYALDAKGEPRKDAPPVVCSTVFTEKVNELLAAAEHGAVLVSPCISNGEREIARRAVQCGFKTITLKNKGFDSLSKPKGALFDVCAAGNVLLLAPATWPYVPGRKPITRVDACVLNRLAQCLSGEGAVEIHYHGIEPREVDHLTAHATQWRRCAP